MMKTKIIVNISDAKISRNPNDVIMTYALGSCIAVCLYDPGICIGGMLHYQLPDSKIDSDKSKDNPFMFADTGITVLLDKLLSLGAGKNRIKTKIAGGASMDTGPKGFDIGKRNHIAIRKIMWQNGLMINAEDVGGFAPRNMYMDIADGSVMIRLEGLEKTL
jgi:chemotaxis protein CheD